MYSSRSLHVRIAGSEILLAMKCMAARPKDIDDLRRLGARVGIGWDPAGGDGRDLKVAVVPMGEAGPLILGPCPCEGCVDQRGGFACHIYRSDQLSMCLGCGEDLTDDGGELGVAAGEHAPVLPAGGRD